MVRTYKRKSQRGAGNAYTCEDMDNALSDVKNGKKSIRGASIFYKIPHSTLQHYINGTRGSGKKSIHGGGGGGVVSYLSKDDEDQLANCVRVLDKYGFGLSQDEVLDIVEGHITHNQLKTRFKNNRPGKDWLISFKARHGLQIKKPAKPLLEKEGELLPISIVKSPCQSSSQQQQRNCGLDLSMELVKLHKPHDK